MKIATVFHKWTLFNVNIPVLRIYINLDNARFTEN